MSAPVAAQGNPNLFQLRYTFHGASVDDHFGTSVAGAGDVNGDGFDDVIVGASATDILGAGAGSVYVYSGEDGQLLWQFDGNSRNQQMGKDVDAAGDVDQDGFADIVVMGNGGNGIVRVYSGKAGQLLWSVVGTSTAHFARSVAGVGDVNGDGIPDVAVGVNRPWPDGQSYLTAVHVYSGIDGALLLNIDRTGTGPTPGPALRISRSLDGAGDVNRDGFADLIAGAQAGFATVYSGRDGSPLWEVTGTGAQKEWRGVAGAGDVNQDGVPDLAVGDYAFGGFSGAVNMYSGQDGTLLWQAVGASGEALGRSVDSTGDVNRDGIPDVVASAGVFGIGPVHVYSGSDGELLWRLPGLSTTNGELRNPVGGAGDVNGDGLPDIIVSNAWNSSMGFRRGSVWVYTRGPIVASTNTLGAGCPSGAGTPALAAAPGSVPKPNGTFSLQLTSLPVAQFVRSFGILGFSKTNWAGIELPRDLGLLGAPGCTQYVAADVVTVLPAAGGTSAWNIAIPNDNSLIGLRFFLQALVEDVLGPVRFSVTNAIEGVVGNQ